jgi:preprotein translocase subunit YajC
MFFLFFAMAQPQGTGQGTGGAGWLAFLPWLAIIVVFYFLLIRPQAKRQKQQQEMLKAIERGDKVVTAGGIHGSVVGIRDENILIVKIADNVKVEIERNSIARVVKGTGEA